MRQANPHLAGSASDVGVPGFSGEILLELTASGEIQVLAGTPAFSVSAPDGVDFYMHGYSSDVNFAIPLQASQTGCVTQIAVLKRRLQVLSDHAGAYPLYRAFSAIILIICIPFFRIMIKPL